MLKLLHALALDSPKQIQPVCETSQILILIFEGFKRICSQCKKPSNPDNAKKDWLWLCTPGKITWIALTYFAPVQQKTGIGKSDFGFSGFVRWFWVAGRSNNLSAFLDVAGVMSSRCVAPKTSDASFWTNSSSPRHGNILLATIMCRLQFAELDTGRKQGPLRSAPISSVSNLMNWKPYFISNFHANVSKVFKTS